MAGYSSYSFKAVKKQFGLKSVKNALFEDFKPVEPSAWLVGTLEKTMKMAVISEKSRSEWLVSPIMIEIKDKNARSLNILSGENLDVDKDLSLTGECDFLFVRDPDTITVESPIFCLVEAERNDLMGGLGQCVAQMLGARLLNQQDGIEYPAIYGCVTTGTDWQFLKLENQLITLETNLKYIVELNHILGIFQRIIDAFV